MRQTATRVVTEALEDVDVECTHCGVRMTMHLGSGQRVRYFRCAGCHRWVTSSYAEVFRVDGKVRAHPRREEAEAHVSFDVVKLRLERWLAALDEQDPYHLLGVSPHASLESIRERYRQLALENHPDRGGSAERMGEVNAAYEKVLQHRERTAKVPRPPEKALVAKAPVSHAR